MKVSSDFIH